MGNSASIADSLTAIPAKETYVWYRKFMIEYPSGLQTLHELKTLLGLQGLNQKANQHVDQVYNTFDMNKGLLLLVNLVVRGKMEQKLKWYFKLYDADGNGSIDKKELLNTFIKVLQRAAKIEDGLYNKRHGLRIKTVQALNGQQTLSPEEFANLVFLKIDINHDGELTLEEFISGTEKDQDLLEIVSESFDFSNVLKIICNGKKADTGGGFLQTI